MWLCGMRRTAPVHDAGGAAGRSYVETVDTADAVYRACVAGVQSERKASSTRRSRRPGSAGGGWKAWIPGTSVLAPGLLPKLDMRPSRHRSRGFTLIELLVVVSIIGVLAAIAIPSFMGRQGKAYDARVMLDAKSAASGQEAYFVDNGTYFTGACSGLPGMSSSPGVTCTTTGGSNSYAITTSHPMATKTCVWTNDGVPNLICS